MDLVDIEDPVLQYRLRRGKETALDPHLVEEGEDVREVINITVVEGQKCGGRWQTVDSPIEEVKEIFHCDERVVLLYELQLTSERFEV